MPVLVGLEITDITAGNAIVEDAIIHPGEHRGRQDNREPLKALTSSPDGRPRSGVGEQTGALETMPPRSLTTRTKDEATANLLALLDRS